MLNLLSSHHNSQNESNIKILRIKAIKTAAQPNLSGAFLPYQSSFDFMKLPESADELVPRVFQGQDLLMADESDVSENKDTDK